MRVIGIFFIYFLFTIVGLGGASDEGILDKIQSQ